MSYVYVSKKGGIILQVTLFDLAPIESSAKNRVQHEASSIWLSGFGSLLSMFHKLPSCLIIVLITYLQVVLAESDLHPRTSLNTDPNNSTFLWLPQDEYSGPSFFECVFFILFSWCWVIENDWKATGTFSLEMTQHSERSLFTTYVRYWLDISSESGTVKWVFALSILLSSLWYPYSSYTTKADALATSLAFVTPDGKVIMQGDNTTWLSEGVSRRRYASIPPLSSWTSCGGRSGSVRISSIAQYNGGLFILDLDKAPWGCGKVKQIKSAASQWFLFEQEFGRHFGH